MFTVHGTRKLLDRVKAPVVEACEPTTLLGNWYATALFWKPRQVALLVNEQTLLPAFVPLAPATSLADRIGHSVGLVLEELDVGIDVVLQETAAMAEVSFAKTANRSVVGSMNEFAYHGEFRNDQGWDLTAIAVGLADLPCGPLYKTHGRPGDALHAAIAEATGQPVPARRPFRRQSVPPVELPQPSMPEPSMLVADLTHFSDVPADANPELAQLAGHLHTVTAAATSRSPGRSWASALPCIHVADRACRGHIVVHRSDIPPSIEWRCSDCGDGGTISNWQGSSCDLRRRGAREGGGPLTITVPGEVVAVLRTILILDPDCERIVYASKTTTDRGAELSGTIDDFEQLVGFVASEANHEEDRKRVKVLDSCLETLEEALSDLG